MQVSPPPYKSTSYKGFTLVELAIVLVIIGLLIGGILAAQSMIGAAKINAQVAQIQQFDAGVMNFKTKYNFLPGDAPAFGGDGDGVIIRLLDSSNCPGNNNGSVNAIQAEIANFWAQTFPDKYISISYATGINYATDTQFFNRFPAPKLGIKGAFIMATAKATDSGGRQYCVDIANLNNYYVMVAPANVPSGSTFTTATSGSRSTTPSDTLAMDKKMDDGLADSGSVIAGSFRTPNTGASAAPLASCSSGSIYVVSNTGYECTPIIRIGSQAGDSQ